jgi:hypothetical protein
MNTKNEAKTSVFAPMYSLYRCEASRFAACTYDIMNTKNEEKKLQGSGGVYVSSSNIQKIPS